MTGYTEVEIGTPDANDVERELRLGYLLFLPVISICEDV